MPTLENSTFLDLTSYGTTTATTVEAAFQVTGTPAVSDVNVAFILPRANDPTALLTSNWATRQTTLEQLKDNGTLWSTYGATTSDYNNAYSILSSHGTIIGNASGSDGYVTSQESRTIWVKLTAPQFETLFSTKPYQAGDLYYWNGNLSVPSGLNVAGLWFERRQGRPARRPAKHRQLHVDKQRHIRRRHGPALLRLPAGGEERRDQHGGPDRTRHR